MKSDLWITYNHTSTLKAQLTLKPYRISNS